MHIIDSGADQPWQKAAEPIISIYREKRLRAVLERLSHRVVVRRRLPAPFTRARIYASTEGGLRYLRPSMGKVDPVLLRLAAETVSPGDTVWDIGANLGLFSFAAAVAAGRGGRVLSVEPDVVLVRMLRRSASASPDHAPVDVLPAAVTDQCGVVRFCIAKRNRSTSHVDGFGTTQTGGVRATELVPAFSLDWLAEHFPPPDVLKIDVEGAEGLVLSGATAVLRGHPRIICEVARENAPVVRDLLAGSGYTLYDGELPVSQRSPVDQASPNTLAVSGTWPR
jgi:FkbM family methyltransferase